MERKIKLRFVLTISSLLLISQFFVGFSYSVIDYGDAKFNHLPARISPRFRTPTSPPKRTWIKEAIWWPVHVFVDLLQEIPPFDSRSRMFGWPVHFMRGAYSVRLNAVTDASLWEILWPFGITLHYFDLIALFLDLIVCYLIVVALLKLGWRLHLKELERESQDPDVMNGQTTGE